MRSQVRRSSSTVARLRGRAPAGWGRTGWDMGTSGCARRPAWAAAVPGVPVRAVVSAAPAVLTRICKRTATEPARTGRSPGRTRRGGPGCGGTPGRGAVRDHHDRRSGCAGGTAAVSWWPRRAADDGAGAAPTPAVAASRDGHRVPVAPAAPAWAVRTLVVGAALLVLAAVAWLLFWVLLRLPLVTVTVAVALLLTAIVHPFTRLLSRALPRALAALLSVFLLFGLLAGVGFLVGFRAAEELRDLARPLAAGIDRIRVWLIEGPLGLDPQQVTEARNAVVDRIFRLAPEPTAAAGMALYVLAAVVLVAFLTFFLLKDGASMWAWALRLAPARRREQVDGAGRTAWTTLSQYVRGVVIVALIDAVGIGAALLVLGVPLWPSLTLLTFLGAFVPLFGATVSGAVAVLVTLVTNGLTDAVIVLVAVLVVQQVEGNVLHPVIVGRALRLHPVVILVAVTAGTMLWGLAGALLAVPLVAVSYRVLVHLRENPVPGPAPAVPRTEVPEPAPESTR
ncbi:AI-2E family transporter [Blastococcus sp. MG754426]|nr:AI-2E family transporter [Blastococcus sp. MG754426]MCF6511980.1 AI-2E family transporter [Blastococcus sp. MG754427]